MWIGAAVVLLSFAAADSTYTPGVVDLDTEDGTERLQRSATEGGIAVLARLETQTQQSWCGLATICTVFNALHITPAPELHGLPWWTQESLLEATGTEADVHPQMGLTLDQVSYIASYRMASQAVHASDEGRGSVSQLREDLIAVFQNSSRAITVNFDRLFITSKSGGHHSPLCAYDSVSDSVLLADVTRYKFPPMWVPLETLHAAVNTPDSASGLNRGWLLLSMLPDGQAQPLPTPEDPIWNIAIMAAAAALAVFVVGACCGGCIACLMRRRSARLKDNLDPELTGLGKGDGVQLLPKGWKVGKVASPLDADRFIGV